MEKKKMNVVSSMCKKIYSPVQAIGPEDTFLVGDYVIRRGITHGESEFVNVVNNAVHTPMERERSKKEEKW
jgi:hypothetical protein